MKTFEIWLADIGVCIGDTVYDGLQPAVIVAAEPEREDDPMVTIVPCTEDLCFRQRQTHVLLQGQGLRQESRALCERIMTVDKSQLRRKLGEVTEPYDRFAIRRALSVHLGIPEVWEWA